MDSYLFLFLEGTGEKKTISTAGVLFVNSLFLSGETFQLVIVPLMLVGIVLANSDENIRCQLMICESDGQPVVQKN